MMRKLLPATRYLVGIAVAGSMLAATGLFVYSAIDLLRLLQEAFSAGKVSAKGAKELVVGSIQVVDQFLLGTVLYIIALGLYELFIDDTLKLPAWLEVHNLDDLKGKLTGVVILVLGVLFLGKAVNWEGEENILPFGVAVAAVIAALTYFLGNKPKKPSGRSGAEGSE
jgi:uncharacterized membrane protein YqhA